MLRTEGTMLDIGCQDLYFYSHLKPTYEITLADYDPIGENIEKQDIQDLDYDDNSFDIVLALEVLEHVPDPIEAISELKRVAKKQLIISVPNEPWFSFWRGMTWERQHLWAITPAVLKHYLGEPSFEKVIVLKRYYLGVWNYE